MIITRKWLEKYLDLSNITNEQISVCLNSLGFEVEQEIDYSKLNTKLVIGHIEESDPIEGTKLKKTKTRIGENKYATILSTSRNIEEDKFAIVALPGAKLANGLELENREILGILSEGMFCGFNEIGLPNSVLTEDEQQDVYYIDSIYKNMDEMVGREISEVLNFDDYTFEVDLTLNRSDALAAKQLVKEIANYFDLKINNNEHKVKFEKPTESITIDLNKKVEDEVNTVSHTFIGLKNTNTPFDSSHDVWLKHSNVKSAQNKFENIANMATLISGQPFILIDADKVNGELTLTKQTIDEKELIVLKSGNSIVNILGLKTEDKFKVTEDTVTMLVVMLNLDQISMRKQQRNLNVSTVDTQRYAKPLNPNLYDQGIDELVSILDEYKMLEDVQKVVTTVQKQNYDNVYSITLEKVQDILGIEITVEEIISLFRTLDIEISVKKSELTFTVDKNRTDLYGKNDLCEEIARLYGYDNIIEQPLEYVSFKKTKNLDKKLKDKLSDYLVGAGFNNIKTYSLTDIESNKTWNLFKVKDPVVLMSPLSIQRETFRNNLSKSMIDTIIFNANNGNKSVKFFEMADIFALNGFRQSNLCFGVSGEAITDSLSQVHIKSNYAYISSILMSVLDLYKVDVTNVTFEVNDKAIDEIHPYINATVKYKNKKIGFIYKLNPAFEQANKIYPTFICEVNLNLLLEIADKVHVTNEISKFQKSTRDISFELSNDVNFETIVKAMLKDLNYLTNYKVIDKYSDEQMDKENISSLTVKLSFNSLDHQLTEKEINDDFEKILNNLKELKVKVR
ncbi:Phenylalanyl-tRNA synthetase beta chain [Mesoplasma florum W37]|uniref:Phenylalanine--tRNA ligase beta subunit n=1 Tax=Mesoplasma florum TaxID=2151 RepID=A0AAD2JDJ1_MESFO|nr:phenylalanine--tRNA ligase subunit beta [Mesoplasma florum]AGY41488.1 Phenylalanyl-tRNA synthetase beta chain [Mesoplasma florum W37]AVN59704.1 phenylalanine--tRNA ligase subunit beta [Mesoplasma florum]AVN65827.1 Phenylalanyl-tRNA synthetase beta chain [Mesoplasma florum]